jgi:uncharacterized protein YbaR (Trm112 family)
VGAVDVAPVTILRCPRCRGALVESAKPAGLGCTACRLLYPVEDGIPSLLADDARPWEGPRT